LQLRWLLLLLLPLLQLLLWLEQQVLESEPRAVPPA
jgi:hypothetical protein